MRWRARHPEHAGFVLTFEQSAAVCHTFYGTLIEDLGGEPRARELP